MRNALFVLILMVMLTTGCVARTARKSVAQPFKFEVEYPKKATYDEAYIRVKVFWETPLIRSLEVTDNSMKQSYELVAERGEGEGTSKRTAPSSWSLRLHNMFTDSQEAMSKGKHTYTLRVESESRQTVTFKNIVIKLQ